MHELAVTEGILAVTLEAAQRVEASRITSIDLVIGDLSSIVDDSVQFYFDLLSQGTLAEGAALRFEREHARVDCRHCGHQFQAELPLTPECPACGSFELKITGGKEFYVRSIEVEHYVGE